MVVVAGEVADDYANTKACVDWLQRFICMCTWIGVLLHHRRVLCRALTYSLYVRRVLKRDSRKNVPKYFTS